VALKGGAILVAIEAAMAATTDDRGEAEESI
jgi:hypothetical protein